MSRQTSKSLVFVAALLGLVGCASAPLPPTTPATPDLSQIINAASSAETSVVAVTAPAACCKQTLPEFLGVHSACGGILGCLDRIRNRLGMFFPGLEAKPELLAISDPANAGVPGAVGAAASVKAKEDAAAQKVKAIKYLATIGCVKCYPEIEEAFLLALTDCTEEVRFAAASAIRDTAQSSCGTCCSTCCCSKKMQEKLIDIAYGKDEVCCFKEPSARVRRMARLALCSCCPPVEPTKDPNAPPVTPLVPDIEGADDDGASDLPPPPVDAPPPVPPAPLPTGPGSPPPPPADAEPVAQEARRLPTVASAPLLAPASGAYYQAEAAPATGQSQFAR